MKRFVFALAALLAVAAAELCPVPAFAGCGADNPNCIVPTAPPGTSDNRAASTAFVQETVAAPALPQNQIFVGSAADVAAAVAMGGDCSIVADGVVTCTKTDGTSFGALATVAAGTGVPAAAANPVNAANGFLTYGIIGTSGGELCLLNANCVYSGNFTATAGTNVFGGTLANGSTAATQSPGDNTAKLATDAFVLANAGSGTAVTPAQYGAVCNNSTDDTTALNSMFSGMAAGSAVTFPATKCKTTGTVTIGQAASISIPAGGGITATGTGDAISIGASNVSISCAFGAVINGPRTPSTGNTYLAGNSAILVNATYSSQLTHIRVTGCTIENFEETAIWAYFCNTCYFGGNSLEYLSYAGILCEVCTSTVAERNYIYSVSSSNGPAYTSSPTQTKTNAYGITFTTDGSGHFSEYDIAANNIINLVPTWECLDTHAGIGIKFVNNHCVNVRVGVQVTTDGGSNAPSDVLVSGNHVFCYPLSQPVYPGSSSISVGGAGIYAAGVASGNQATDVQIVNNLVNGCGSSETGTAAQANIEAGDADNIAISGNNITAGRFVGVLLYDQVIGQIVSNNFNGLVSGPIGSNDILLYVDTTECQCLLSKNLGNSSGSYGYYITAQAGGYEVGIARDNLFFNLTALYSSGGPATNRTDLGATAP